MESTQLPNPQPQPEAADVAIKAWNTMQGIDWQAFPVVAELYGVEDIEGFIVQLTTIREYQNARRN